MPVTQQSSELKRSSRGYVWRAFQKFWRVGRDVGAASTGELHEPERLTPIGYQDRCVVAYCIGPPALKIEAASAKRGWMDATGAGFANRCLPLRIANQDGWFLLNDRKIEAIWNGGDRIPDLLIRYYKKDSQEDVARQQLYSISHFGHGILTWQIPYLFRTSPGYNLYVRGPSNWCKDGACPLDGIVETDWSPATFTMNWKITRVGVPILFESGEPICMIFPHRRGETERFRAEMRELGSDQELALKYRDWDASRRQFNKTLLQPGSKPTWQKHYFQGRSATDNEEFSGHQIELTLHEFADLRKQSLESRD